MRVFALWSGAEIGVMGRLSNMLSGLRKSEFVKNVLIVMSGTAGAQVIGFALTPVISRFYSPSDFGVFGSFSSIAGVAAAAATLQYSQAIVLPKENEEGIHLFVVSCLCASFAFLLCVTCGIVIPTVLNGLMKTTGVWALVLLTAATIISGLNQSCQAWCIRVKAFKQTSTSQVVRSLSSNGAQIGFGALRGGAPWLIASSIIADLVATLNLARVVRRDLGALGWSIRWKEMRRLARDYSDFPRYSASMNVISSLSLGLPVLLLTHFYGIAIAGAYAFGMRILTTPMGFVQTALRQVLLQKAAEAHNDGDRLMPLYVKITSGLFLVMLLPSLALFIWAPRLFTLIFGSQWQMAGEFARSLVMWTMFMLCNLPAILFTRIIRIQGRMFVFDIIVLAARAMVLLGGGMFLSAGVTVLLVSLVGAIMNVVFIIIVGSILKKLEGEGSLSLLDGDV